MPRLHVLRQGQGPTLLLLHGIGSSATAWRGQMGILGDRFTCLAPDLPGYGESPDASAPGLDAIVADVADVLDGQPAHVLGVSFGALTALALARQRPELVMSLVLSDATLGRGHLPLEERQRWLRHREGLANDLAVRSVERAGEIAGRGASAAVIQEIALHMRRARPAGYLGVAHAIAETDARPWLASIRQPTLLLCGEDDRVTGMDVSQTLLDQLAAARLLVIAGAGHAPHIEQPDRFAQAVCEFLQVQAGRSGPA
ncbi:MAG: alpha/beta hydrolase [Burkholderiales bacterium]|nr:alpha/beta hydrolase [Burkholderiales bacterium]